MTCVMKCDTENYTRITLYALFAGAAVKVDFTNKSLVSLQNFTETGVQPHFNLRPRLCGISFYLIRTYVGIILSFKYERRDFFNSHDLKQKQIKRNRKVGPTRLLECL